MPSFNKPYLTDEELEISVKEKKRKDRMDKRGMRDFHADKIFKCVREEIDKGTENFSKKEMIALVQPSQPDPIERIVWYKACNEAINRLRLYYWGNKNADYRDRRMFNYVRDEKRYYLVPLTEEFTLGINVIYDAYWRKMKGLANKQRQIATSLYRHFLKISPDERKKVIQELRKQKLIENGNCQKEIEK